jgi:hypothetical protein
MSEQKEGILAVVQMIWLELELNGSRGRRDPDLTQIICLII